MGTRRGELGELGPGVGRDVVGEHGGESQCSSGAAGEDDLRAIDDGDAGGATLGDRGQRGQLVPCIGRGVVAERGAGACEVHAGEAAEDVELAVDGGDVDVGERDGHGSQGGPGVAFWIVGVDAGDDLELAIEAAQEQQAIVESDDGGLEASAAGDGRARRPEARTYIGDGRRPHARRQRQDARRRGEKRDR